MTRDIGIVHPVLAVVVQWLLSLVTGNLWIGAAATSGFFLGREIAQAEYRWIETYGLGRRANMPWWGRFDKRVWNLHSMTDWLLPIIFTLVVAILAKRV